MKQVFIKSISFLSLISSVLFSVSCGNDDSPAPKTLNYSVITTIGEQTYLVSAESLEEGTITSEGHGLELDVWLSELVGSDFYFFNGTDYTLDKYSVAGNSFTKIDAISLDQIIPGGRPRVMHVNDDGTLLSINGWASSESVVEYGVFDLSDFSVAKSGTVTLPNSGEFSAAYAGAELLVSGNKAYFATMHPSENWDDTNGLTTVVYDYPSFTNAVVITNNSGKGQVAGHVGSTNVMDENGDIYQVSITSDHWFEQDVPFTPVVTKISDGAYDDTYDFDLSNSFDKPVDVWGLMYAGNGIAYARVSYTDQVDGAEDEWTELTKGNSLFLAKLDLYNKTATKLNVPLSAMYYTQDGAAKDGKFYFPIAVVGGDANIYIFDIDGGADDFEVGAEIEGENVTVANIYAH